MRVLLSTDGSKDAKAATEYLRDFPLPADTTVSVLSVAQVPQSPIEAPTVEQFRESVREAARRAAEDARAALAPRWPGAEIAVVDGDARGDPREAIIRAAEDADLVVLGARGLSAVKGFLLGSVSIAVTRYAPCSVLVVKGAAPPLRHAVIGVDGSEDSLHAVRFFASLGDGLRALRVTLLGVVEEVRYPSTAPGRLRAQLKAALEELHRQRRAELEATVAAAGDPLRPQVAAVGVQVDIGRPPEILVARANRPDCDLVVVGARGLGALKRMLLGSASEKVVRHARCPVLIVKRR